MKKEACALTLLILMFFASFVNIRHLDGITGEISALIEEAAVYALDGKWEEARGLAGKARDKWENSDEYTHMVLRHSEIESAGDVIGEFIKEVYAEDTGRAKGAAEAAVSRMKSIASIEKIRFGSVF